MNIKTTKKLKDLGKIFQGGTPSKDNLNFWNGNIPFVTGADITSINVSSARSFLTEQGIKSGKTVESNDGDILIVSRTGVGRVGIAKRTMGISQDVTVLKLYENYDPDYVCWFLLGLTDKLQTASQGATIKGLTRNFIENLDIQIPTDKKDQEKMAQEISKKMESTSKMRESAEKQEEAVNSLQDAILRELYFYKSVDKLPTGWSYKKISEIADISPSRTKTHNRLDSDATSFIPMESVDEKIGKANPYIKKFGEVKTGYTYFEDGDIIFAKITPCMQNKKSAIVSELLDGIGYGSTEFVVLRAKKGINNRWILHFLRTSEFLKDAVDHFTGSAGQQRVPTYFVNDYLIPYPPDDEVKPLLAKLELKLQLAQSIFDKVYKQSEAVSAYSPAILKQAFAFA